MRPIASALLALLILSPGVAAAPRRAPARDWRRVVAVAPNGAYVMGNPAARAKVIEYSSMTCPHCADAAAEMLPALEAGYVRSGAASLEVRTAVRDRYDLAATLLARCEGPRGYFATATLLFAHQQDWIRQAGDWERADGNAALAGKPVGDALAAIAEGAGLTKLVAGRGRTPAATRACLTDPAAPKVVTAMADEAWQQRQITGTPAFFVNGAAVDAHDWATLEPAVRAAAGLPPAPAPASPSASSKE